MSYGRKYISSKLSRLKRIGQILSEEGFINDDQLNIALEIQQSAGGLLGDILVSQRYVTEWELARCLVDQLQLPMIHTRLYDISNEINTLLPHAFLHQHRLVPLDRFGKSLVLATNGSITEEIVEEIEVTTKLDVMLYVALTSDIQNTLQNRFPIEKLTNEMNQKFDQLFQDVDFGESASPDSASDGTLPDTAADPDEWRPES